MDETGPMFLAALAIALACGIRNAQRRAFVRGYALPAGVAQRLRRAYPQYSRQEIDRVLAGLRDWFLIALAAGRRPLSMPSRIVDAAWHELILDTRAYREFCATAFGRYFDHVPAEAMRSPTLAQDGIRRAWRLACAHEGIDRRKHSHLPRLFALDAQLAVSGGYVYVLDCAQGKREEHCASDIDCASGCRGSTEGGDGGDGGGGCGGD